MKNKKLIFISAFLILAVAGGIFFAAGKIEEKWEVKEKGTNNLTSNSESIIENKTTFDYPYTVLTPEVLLNKGWQKEEVEDRFEHIETQEGKNGRISYQKAVNIVGELIKDIYGDTSPQTTPLYVYNEIFNEVIKHPDVIEKHNCMIVSTNVGQLGYGNQYIFNLDAVSGKVTRLQHYVGAPRQPLPEGKTMSDYAITEEQAKEMFYNEIRTVLKLFGENSEAEKFYLVPRFETDENSIEHYMIICCENEQKYIFTYDKFDQSLLGYMIADNDILSDFGLE